MSIQDILMPGGKPVGAPGSSSDIREVQGGLREAQNFFDELKKGGSPKLGTTHPNAFDLSGGGAVGFRPASKSGPPTIDVNIPGIPIRKIKFV
ncbi:MAG: hypothetical protein JSS27_04710 [Planctomycetes bacterium]|nr:hypothetical protein [Planctomycetota bacterium]